MQEILPGVWHWTSQHEKIGVPVHSCFLPNVGGGVLVDPQVPDAGLEAISDRGEPAVALLTNRHHYRHSGRFREAFGTTVYCHEAGMHEFTHGEEVEPFTHGDRLAGGIEALEVGVICPEETALLIPVHGGILALGDCVIRYGGEMGFVPEEHLGDDPEAVKRGIKASLARLLDREFDHLLFAHGEPLVGRGKATLEAFVSDV
jgi:hypothetical protein